jgi:transcription initiation factor TFIIIB Brf1 subunit/transcription initiation factor TFIIB
MGLVTVKSAHLESDLLVLRSKLESAGVKCHLRNEFTTQIMNYMPTFEVELQVSEQQIDKALEIINKLEGNE